MGLHIRKPLFLIEFENMLVCTVTTLLDALHPKVEWSTKIPANVSRYEKGLEYLTGRLLVLCLGDRG